MKKDFDTWNERKKNINSRKEPPFYREREVHWCRLGMNVGYEQDGTGKGFSRPVLILKGFSRNVCLVVPLTTSQKESKYHISIGRIGKKNSSIIISQLRLVDTKRLHSHIETLDKELFDVIRKAVKDML